MFYVGLDGVVSYLICLPVFVGPLLAVPFGVTSSSPMIGRIAARFGIWQIPEEETPPVIVRALALPALSARHGYSYGIDKYKTLTTDQLLTIEEEVDTAAGVLRNTSQIAA